MQTIKFRLAQQGGRTCAARPYDRSDRHANDKIPFSAARGTITLVSPANPGTCSSDNTTIKVDLKKADGGAANPGNSGGQNYPNPLDASTGFNTTVPFVTSAGGVATITIANEKGVKVLTDDEEILGAGSHFFYFSGKDLPSGTYYYTIEFPQGVVIASKTMLIVK